MKDWTKVLGKTVLMIDICRHNKNFETTRMLFQIITFIAFYKILFVSFWKMSVTLGTCCTVSIFFSYKNKLVTALRLWSTTAGSATVHFWSTTIISVTLLLKTHATTVPHDIRRAFILIRCFARPLVVPLSYALNAWYGIRTEILIEFRWFQRGVRTEENVNIKNVQRGSW